MLPQNEMNVPGMSIKNKHLYKYRIIIWEVQSRLPSKSIKNLISRVAVGYGRIKFNDWIKCYDVHDAQKIAFKMQPNLYGYDIMVFTRKSFKKACVSDEFVKTICNLEAKTIFKYAESDEAKHIMDAFIDRIL